MPSRIVLTVALALAASAPALAQTTWYVDVSGTPPGTGTQTDPYTSIQYAIDQPTTLDGDTVLVATGTYLENVDFQGKALLVDGSGASPLPRIDAAQSGSAVSFRSGEGQDSELVGFVLTGGTGTVVGPDVFGGGVLVEDASPFLRYLVLEGNTADFGGGIAVLGAASSARLSDSRLEDNSGVEGAGAYVAAGALTLVDDVFEENVGEPGSVQTAGAGALARDSALLVARGCEFRRNQIEAFGLGGAVSAVDATVRLVECTFVENACGSFNLGAGFGGAISVRQSADLYALDCLFERNGATYFPYFEGIVQGGAADGPGMYERCSFLENSAQFGGALHSASSIDCRFEGNEACADGSGYGGAVVWGTHVGGTFERNVACGGGGAIANADIESCVVRANGVYPPDGVTNPSGAGMLGGSAVASLFERNVAQDGPNGFPSRGGGVHDTDLERCVLVDNVAQMGAGAYYGTGVATPPVRFSTIVGNEACCLGSGVWAATAALVVESSIVFGNAGDQIAGNPAPAVAYSCVEGGYPGTGNIALDPLFWGPLALDLHLTAGSPCIDAADPNAPPDGDGSPADMGAFPFDAAYVGAPGRYCTAKTTSGGCQPTIGSSGLPGFSGPDDFRVQADGAVPGGAAVLFSSPAAAAVPFLGGTLCLGAGLARGPIVVASSAGTCGGDLDVAVTQADLAATGLSPGDLLYFQWWIRDGGQADGTAAALSDGLEARLLP